MAAPASPASPEVPEERSPQPGAAAILLGGAYAVELIPSEGIWAKIAGLAVVVLGAFGYAVSRG